MKKLIILALVIVTSATFSTASAKDKKEKNAVAVATSQKAMPVTGSDSLSYAAGMSITDGLSVYLQRQYGITEKRMPDVIRGFKEALAHRNDSAFTAYAAGMQIADMLKSRMLPGLKGELGEINDNLVFEGFTASLEKDYSVYTDSAAQKRFEQGRKEAMDKRNEATRLEGERFLAANKSKEGVKTTPSGLQYKVLKAGNGPVPTLNDKVEVIYEGKTLDGKVFDATSKHGTKSDKFGVGGLIPGWTEALTMMPVGSKWEIYIPQELAYGATGAGQNIKPYSALVFTLELLSIDKASPKSKAGASAAKGKKKVVTTKKKK